MPGGPSSIAAGDDREHAGASGQAEALLDGRHREDRFAERESERGPNFQDAEMRRDKLAERGLGLKVRRMSPS